MGKSYLQNDTISKKLERDRNLKLNKLYTNDDITDIYTCCNVLVGPVHIDQLHLFYANYLKPKGIDLVVFSKSQADSSVYDSRLDSNQQLHRITNDVIFLWLNDGHYDLILSPYTFSQCNANKFCFTCMWYFRRGETKSQHTCTTSVTCYRCYSFPTTCRKEDNFEQKCTECDIIFYNRKCFHNHLTQRMSKSSWDTVESPCQHFFSARHVIK